MNLLEITYYEVRRIQSGKVAYHGRSLAKAADTLAEGMCYGKGPTPQSACKQAAAEVCKFQSAGNYS